jgi:hypothetical protein
MSIKFPSGSNPADFGGKIGNGINKMPEKNHKDIPLSPCAESQVGHSHLEDIHSGQKMGKAITPEDMQLWPSTEDEKPELYPCSAKIKPGEGLHPPKLYPCSAKVEPGQELFPPKMPKLPRPPGIYGCRAEGKPGGLGSIKPQPPGIYQCTAKVDPHKPAPDRGIYQCSFHPPDSNAKLPPNNMYQCSFKPDLD